MIKTSGKTIVCDSTVTGKVLFKEGYEFRAKRNQYAEQEFITEVKHKFDKQRLERAINEKVSIDKKPNEIA